MNIAEWRDSLITDMRRSSAFSGKTICYDYANTLLPNPIRGDCITVNIIESYCVSEVFDDFYGVGTGSSTEIIGKRCVVKFEFTAHNADVWYCERLYAAVIKYLTGRNFIIMETSGKQVKYNKAADCFSMPIIAKYRFINDLR
ncbi:MAG: hypothetical protein FWG69_04115 [Oscillospiraceae bacterium]|nr:hypothetical protein [Oscillospiraceae bacterium]